MATHPTTAAVKPWRAIGAALIAVLSLTLFSVPVLGQINGPVLTAPPNGASELCFPISLNWGSNIPGGTVQAFQVQVSPDAGFSSTVVDVQQVSAGYVVSSLAARTTHYWRVRAYVLLTGYGTVWSEWSATRNFTTAAPVPGAPSPQSPVNAAQDLPLPVAFQWTASSHATSYQIEVDDDWQFGSPEVSLSVTQPNAQVSLGLQYNTLYNWRVRATNECGTGEWSITQIFFTECVDPLAPVPAGPADGAAIDAPAVISWNPVSTALTYTYETSVDPAFQSIIRSASVYGTSVNINAWKPVGTPLYWLVLDEDVCGLSAWPETRQFTVISGLPPIADAGDFQIVSFREIVQLDGTGSRDAEDGTNLSFAWSAPEGIILTGPTTPTPTFAAPPEVKTLSMTLVVTDSDGKADTSAVPITIVEDVQHAVFVAANGVFGSDAGTGAFDDPVQTLTRAVELARSTTPYSDIYLASGEYHTGETIVVEDNMSLYGGFRVALFAPICNPPLPCTLPPVSHLWARDAQEPTHIYGAATAVEARDISVLTVIDGLIITAADGAPGGILKSVSMEYPGWGPYASWAPEGSTFIRRRATFPVTKVWLSDVSTTTTWNERTLDLQGTGTSLVTPQLTHDPRACLPDPGPRDFHDDEILLNYQSLYWMHPPYALSYLEAAVASGCPATLTFSSENAGFPIEPRFYCCVNPGQSGVEGYELVKETFFLFSWSWSVFPTSRFEQVLRGPDGELYLYRPGTDQDCDPSTFGFNQRLQLFFNGDRYVGDELPGEAAVFWNLCHGPVPMESYLHGNDLSRVYDIVYIGRYGQNSVGLSARNCSRALRISNCLIEAGRGGVGGTGTTGGDGGFGGEGGYGGHSIGISLYAASPTILRNTIRVAGGGNGGNGAGGEDGNDGGYSCGLELLNNSAPVYMVQNLTMQIGLAGRGGVPNGRDGLRSTICPPPAGGNEPGIPLPPVTLVPQQIYTTTASVPAFSSQAAFSQSWPGSDVMLRLVSPTGRVIDRNTADPDVFHELGPTFEHYVISHPEQGDWTMEVTGLDVAPEGEQVELALVVYPEAAPPEIECPGDMVVQATSPLGAAVGFEALVPEDCGCVATIAYSKAPGSMFPPGSTEVVCTATSDVGLSSECTFTITVEQGSGSVFGIVTNAPTSGDPVPLAGLSIRLVDAGGSSSVSAVTSEGAGTFEFADIPNGHYTVELEVPLGFSPVAPPAVTVDLQGEPVEVNFQLAEAATGKIKDLWWWSGKLADIKNNCVNPAFGLTRQQVDSLGEKIFAHFYLKDGGYDIRIPYLTYVGEPAGPLTFDEVYEVFFGADKNTTAGKIRMNLLTVLLDVASGDINQLKVVSADGAKVCQAITYYCRLYPFGWSDWTVWWHLMKIHCPSFGIIPACVIPLATPTVLYKPADESLPTDFSLSQNYPNPFNPVTDIEFGLPSPCHVRLEVYNVVGQTVVTLVDGRREAGFYTVSWDGSNVASGVYLYRLTAGDYVQTRKMLLLK